MSIQKNIQDIQYEIQKITSKPVKLIAVTKNRTLEEIQDAIKAGITDIGGNRVPAPRKRGSDGQETKEKLFHLPKTITKHFIGRLQTNKVRDAVRLFDVIQSVDSLKLARKIDEECGKIHKTMPILIQVNTSDEPQKGGVPLRDVIPLIEDVSKLKNIQIQGLMTIAIHSADKKKVRNCFRKLRQLFNKIKNSDFEFRTSSFEFCSMGMSEDYRIAIKEGANMVRIGRGIFRD